ncbi:MAG: LLM class flavin-dependent oxidoreductase [Thaumarchaeota archaeon]|nr:LLM class flavin-dependent oxidoreductase [Nitrososphaerota archaeon]
MTKVGIGFTGVPWTYQQTLELVKYADEKSFDTAWMAEDYFTRNAPAVLGAWAAETKKIKLATGILPVFTRHVALGAMTAATLDEISGGRMIFGLGFGLTNLMTVNMGFTKPPAITAIREYSEAFKLIMKGENVNYDGTYVKCKNVKLGITPVRNKVPLYLAANQQKMLRLAGEVADGVLLTAGTTPEHVAYAYDRIAEGAKLAGRNKDDVKVTGFVFVAVSEDKNFNAYRDIPLMKIFPAYCLSGEYGELIADLSGYDKAKIAGIREALVAGDVNKAGSFVDEHMVHTMSALGTPEQVKSRLREFASVGGGKFEPIIFLIGGDLRLGVETAASL